MSDWMTRVPRGIAPPAAVRARIAAGLRRDGLLPAKRHGAGLWLQAAAALVLFAAGWLAASAFDARDDSHPPRYMLLLFGETSAPADVAVRVAEYGAWARELRATGERLGDASVAVGSEAAPAGAGALGGYFLIDAPSMEAARALAEGHPHVRLGGTIVVRPIAGS